MKTACAGVYVNGVLAATLEEVEPRRRYRLAYVDGYAGPPISLTIPTVPAVHEFDRFPAFFEGLLPEGEMLEALIRQRKLDRHDLFGQLLVVGGDLVGAVAVKERAA